MRCSPAPRAVSRLALVCGVLTSCGDAGTIEGASTETGSSGTADDDDAQDGDDDSTRGPDGSEGSTGADTGAVDESSGESGGGDVDCSTWEQHPAVPGVDWYDIAWIDDQRGWIVGVSATAITTSDGGETWTSVDIGTTDDLRTVSFAPGSSSGWIVGGTAVDSLVSAPTTIRRTEDGGTTWTAQETGIFFPPTRVYATSAQQAWILWGLGEFHPDGHWQRTFDGGSSWVTPEGDFLRPGRALMDAFFIDELEGWIAASNTEVQAVIDGMEVETPIVGPGKRGIFHTIDGGSTWELQPTPIEAFVYFTGVHFADADHGWVVDDAGGILATEDGGETWVLQSSGVGSALRSVHARDASTGWTVGADGIILRTDDGGAQWTPEASGTTSVLRRIAAPPGGDSPWAVGDGGVVLHCTAP